jgi:hypothetical protein
MALSKELAPRPTVQALLKHYDYLIPVVVIDEVWEWGKALYIVEPIAPVQGPRVKVDRSRVTDAPTV